MPTAVNIELNQQAIQLATVEYVRLEQEINRVMFDPEIHEEHKPIIISYLKKRQAVIGQLNAKGVLI